MNHLLLVLQGAGDQNLKHAGLAAYILDGSRILLSTSVVPFGSWEAPVVYLASALGQMHRQLPVRTIVTLLIYYNLLQNAVSYTVAHFSRCLG